MRKLLIILIILSVNLFGQKLQDETHLSTLKPNVDINYTTDIEYEYNIETEMIDINFITEIYSATFDFVAFWELSIDVIVNGESETVQMEFPGGIWPNIVTIPASIRLGEICIEGPFVDTKILSFTEGSMYVRE